MRQQSQGELLLVPEGRPSWPSSVEASEPFFRDLLARLHAATLAANLPAIVDLDREAHDLAMHLNGEDGMCGITAPDGPGTLLAERTAAPAGHVPLWGQEGRFVITMLDIPVEIEQDGVFGIGGMCRLSSTGYPHFAIHAVDVTLPFFSETGYRSFFHWIQLQPGLRPDHVARLAVEHHFRTEMKSKLVRIAQEYRERRERRETEGRAA